VDEQRRTLWRTAWGVALAACTAFALGYGASRSSKPSINASRPPLWPLPVVIAIGIVSLWFVLAPTLHQWPFDRAAPGDAPQPPAEPWLAELTETGEPDDAPLLPFHVQPTAGTASPPGASPRGGTPPPPG